MAQYPLFSYVKFTSIFFFFHFKIVTHATGIFSPGNATKTNHFDGFSLVQGMQLKRIISMDFHFQLLAP